MLHQHPVPASVVKSRVTVCPVFGAALNQPVSLQSSLKPFELQLFIRGVFVGKDIETSTTPYPEVSPPTMTPCSGNCLEFHSLHLLRCCSCCLVS